jgi:hypothetical protein
MQAKIQNVTFSPEGSFSATVERQVFYVLYVFYVILKCPMPIRNLGNLEKLSRGWSKAPEIRLGLT